MGRVETVLVASTNPVKINAVADGFKEAFKDEDIEFDIQGISINSNVSNQPRTEEETYQGALNRVNGLSQVTPEADYWVGVEGGIYELRSKLRVFAYVIIKSKNGMIGEGNSGAFVLPEELAKLIKEGMELGEADDKVFKRANSKQKDGTVGLLTGGVIDRKRQYHNAIIYALIPFRNPDLY